MNRDMSKGKSIYLRKEMVHKREEETDDGEAEKRRKKT